MNLQLFGGRGGSSGGGGKFASVYGEMSQETYRSMYEIENNKKYRRIDEYGIINDLINISNALNNISIGPNVPNSWDFSSTDVPITPSLRGMAVNYPDRIGVSETLGLDNVYVKDFNGLVSDIKAYFERQTKRTRRKKN